MPATTPEQIHQLFESAFNAGDLAYLSNAWSLNGTGPDGNPVALGATTAEVARRQADGTWRYVIDNAWGDQAATG
jgi:ketosteroid isomerase-like protein